jgi:hypothetical protein
VLRWRVKGDVGPKRNSTGLRLSLGMIGGVLRHLGVEHAHQELPVAKREVRLTILLGKWFHHPSTCRGVF